MAPQLVRVRQLLAQRENFIDVLEASFDDKEKLMHHTQLQLSRKEIQEFHTRIEKAENEGEKGLEDIVHIHAELLNKYLT